MTTPQRLEITHPRKVRALRGVLRAAYLLIGTGQSLLGVMFGVFLAFSTVTDFGEGPSSTFDVLLALCLVAALFCVGLLAMLSSMQEWDPPHDRWQGFRWPIVGGVCAAITLLSWAVIAATGLLS